MVSKRLITAALILIILVMTLFSGGVQLSVAADPGGSAREGGMPAPQMKIAIHNGLLSLDVRDTEIGDILRAVAEKTGIGLTVGEGVGGKVSLMLEGVSLEEALRQLCASRAIIYEYDPQTRTGRIIGAGAFAEASVPSAVLRSETAVPAAAPATAAGNALKLDSGAQKAGEMQPPQGGSLSGTSGEGPLDSRGRLLYKPRELLVRFRPEATAAQMTAFHLSMGSTVLKSTDRLKLHRVQLREGLTEKEGMALYRASKIVAAAERHALRYPLMTPNDPYFVNNQQWGLNKIQMPAAWDITRGNANVVVGVIDTGVDTGHPDLAGNLLPGRDLAGAVGSDETDSDDNPMDKNGHGTHVAGIIAAVGNNDIGVAGIGWNLRIMPLKVLADDSPQDMETFDIVAAIDYAIAQRVRIVNCSFGGSAPSREEYLAFEALRQAGILTICAAGNGINNSYPGVNLDNSEQKTYPAYCAHQPYTDDQGTIHQALDNIVSVAASLNPDTQPPKPENLWASSNYGLNSVDLMAPGDAIRSTWLCPSTGTCSSYDIRTGTSMAAPHVAGVAGLILSRNPGLGYARVKSVILESVDLVTDPYVAAKLLSGGRLNAAAALGRVCLSGI